LATRTAREKGVGIAKTNKTKKGKKKSVNFVGGRECSHRGGGAAFRVANFVERKKTMISSG